MSKSSPSPETDSVNTAPQQIVEIVSDSGEGAQKAGQAFGTVCAKMGNGVWTVEIIPAEIKPPARSRAGASGIRIRFGTEQITNVGDEADLVVAFNEQVLYGRIAQGAYRPGTKILLECKWADDPDENIRKAYADGLAMLQEEGLDVIEIPFEEALSAAVPGGTRVGKNMLVLGMLVEIFHRDVEKAEEEIKTLFRKKGDAVIERNLLLLHAGQKMAQEKIDYRCTVPTHKRDGDWVVMNGNQAYGLGVMASGMEVVAMYPITPATSTSHFLAEAFPSVGGIVHQAEDEIAAIGFAIGASYAGKTACTVTSGPGLALKTEFMGLAVMAEIPLVVLVVQRGGPSTGLPTKVEQGDLLAALYSCPGDAPKVILAPATIEECFHFVVMARKLAEDLRGPVIVLSDANLATGVQPFPRPQPEAAWLAAPIDASPWEDGLPPYDWAEDTGLSPRPIPGQRGGEHTVTGLAHTRQGKVSYDPNSNQVGCAMRSRKLAAFASTLSPPEVRGESEGDLLVIGWGSTLGAIDEAIDQLQAEGLAVSSIHLRFLSPLPPGLGDLFRSFRRVMTVEINYSDDPGSPFIDEENRRRSQLAMLLRERTLVDIDCWSRVSGQPIPPREVVEVIRERLNSLQQEEVACSA